MANYIGLYSRGLPYKNARTYRTTSRIRDGRGINPCRQVADSGTRGACVPDDAVRLRTTCRRYARCAIAAAEAGGGNGCWISLYGTVGFSSLDAAHHTREKEKDCGDRSFEATCQRHPAGQL